jgi:hypothetical protein
MWNKLARTTINAIVSERRAQGYCRKAEPSPVHLASLGVAMLLFITMTWGGLIVEEIYCLRGIRCD